MALNAKNRIVCVHTFVPLYLLSILIQEHLAEHLLLELAARVSNSNDCGLPDSEDKNWLWDMSLWSETQRKSINESIVILMGAAGEGTRLGDVSSKSIPDPLNLPLVQSAGNYGRNEPSCAQSHQSSVSYLGWILYPTIAELSSQCVRTPVVMSLMLKMVA